MLSIAAGGLVTVHRHVCLHEQRIKPLWRFWIHQRVAETNSERNWAHWRPIKPLSDAPNHHICPVIAGIRQEDDELIAAVARHKVGRATRVGQDLRDGLQHLVAHLMAIGIVNALEVVDVHKDHRQRIEAIHAVLARNALHALCLTLIQIRQRAPVVESGKRVP